MLYLEALRESRLNVPDIAPPTSIEGARALQATCFSTNIQARATEKEASSSLIDKAAHVLEDLHKEGHVYEEQVEQVNGETIISD